MALKLKRFDAAKYIETPEDEVEISARPSSPVMLAISPPLSVPSLALTA